MDHDDDPPPYPNDAGRIWMIEYETADFWQSQLEVFSTEAAALAWFANPPKGVFIIGDLGDIWEL